ncbi:MAG: FAD-binding protein [Deltaproteobacteria bacterium]|nr:FAD-binding protein [Deltaproteobacteria bacterium]
MKGLEKDLARLVGKAMVKTDPADLMAYESDAIHDYARGKPEAIVLPNTTDDVATVVTYAYNNRIPVTPRGAGSGLSGGCTPVQGGIVLDTKRMNKIIEINPGNLTGKAECGVVVSRYHRAVEKQNLFYPPDPQSMTVCTLGGNVATRAGGPHGVKYGTTSNYVLGLEVVLPDGSIINTGGSCVKQAVGYDLTHLLTGSEGTLGVITKVTTRLLPKPPADQTIIVTCETPEQASDLVSAIIAAGIVPAMLEYVPQAAIGFINEYLTPPLSTEGGAFLFIKLDGLEVQIAEESKRVEAVCTHLKAIDVRVAAGKKEADSYWKARSMLYPLMVSVMKKVINEDVTVPRDRFPEFIRAMVDLSAKIGLMIGFAGHAGDGNVHPVILMSDTDEATYQKAMTAVREIVHTGLRLGGSISGEHGIGLHKASFLEDELGERQVALLKAIKNTIDPAGIMNPGKIWVQGD